MFHPIVSVALGRRFIATSYKFDVSGQLMSVLVCHHLLERGNWRILRETNITVTQAIVGNYSGEYLQLLISNTVLNLRSCPSGETYVLRDPAIIQSAIAIALTAVASGRQIRVYVTDSCDAPTARPLVSAIGLT